MNGENLGIRGLSTDYIESFPSAVLLPRNLLLIRICFFSKYISKYKIFS